MVQFCTAVEASMSNMNSELYGTKFFNNIDCGSQSSASVILLILKEYLKIQSAIDVGCGTGRWVQSLEGVFQAHAGQIVGMDGGYTRPWHAGLENKFIYTDLNMPFSVDSRFDFAMSLEVAEHLNESRASGFVADLCRLSSVILFSAAIPGQDGTGHVNEQWPDYWRKEFKSNDYVMFDSIRPKIWLDERVEPWYSQNVFLFVHKNKKELIEKLDYFRIEENDWRLKLIHPGIYRMAACESCGAGRLLRALPGRLANSVRNRILHKS